MTIEEADQLAATKGFDPIERTRAFARALVLYRELGNPRGECIVLTLLGNIANNMADFAAALDYFHQAEEIATRLADADLARKIAGQLAFVHAELGDYETALAITMRGWERDASAPDPEIRMLAINSLGCLLAVMGRHEEAVENIGRADDMIDAIGDPRRREHLRSQSLADLSDALLRGGKAQEALDAAERGAARADGIGFTPLVMLNRLYAGRAALGLSDWSLAAERLRMAGVMATDLGSKSPESQARLLLADALTALGRDAEALASYREGHRVEREIRRDTAAQRLEFHRSKREIEAAHRDKESADRVLFAVLPAAIARRMKDGEVRIAEDVSDVSILFADLVGFTPLSRRTPARELLDLLDRIFSEFDELADALGLEKVKTIGDAYMVVGGAPSALPDHLERCAQLGLQMLGAVERMAAVGVPSLAIRIGLHAGPAIAGVIGKRRLSYDFWGETVNLASRLESSGVPGRIHVSEHVANRLKGAFSVEPRGLVTLKGVGEVRTFLLA